MDFDGNAHRIIYVIVLVYDVYANIFQLTLLTKGELMPVCCFCVCFFFRGEGGFSYQKQIQFLYNDFSLNYINFFFILNIHINIEH